MAAGIRVVNWIIIAIAVEVQAVGGFGIQVSGIIGRDKSSPFGGVIPGVQIIQAGIFVVVIAIGTKMGAFAHATSAYLFYHFPRPQSRKSLPGDPGRLGITIRRNSKECLLLSFPIFPKGLKLGFAVTRQGEHKWQPTHTNKLIKQFWRIVQ